MAKYLFLIFFAFLYSASFARHTDSTIIIHQDTINLRGYIYDITGKPVAASVTSKNRSLKWLNYTLFTDTDSTGYFELKGAYVNDTLLVSSIFHQGTYYNRGARYLIITLPRESFDINKTAGKIEVQTPRRYPRLQKPIVINKKDMLTGCVLSMVTGPDFEGGTQGFAKYFRDNLRYPEKAIRANVEGTVKAEFTIAKNGSIIKPRIIEGIGYGCDEEVKRLLLNSRKWIAARYNIKRIETTATISVNFKLADN